MKDVKLSTEEAAIYLEVSERTLSNWRGEKKGPIFYKPRERVYYFKSDCDDWIKSITRFREV